MDLLPVLILALALLLYAINVSHQAPVTLGFQLRYLRRLARVMRRDFIHQQRVRRLALERLMAMPPEHQQGSRTIVLHNQPVTGAVLPHAAPVTGVHVARGGAPTAALRHTPATMDDHDQAARRPRVTRSAVRGFARHAVAQPDATRAPSLANWRREHVRG